MSRSQIISYLILSCLLLGIVIGLLYFQFVYGEPFIDVIDNVQIRGTAIYHNNRLSSITTMKIIYNGAVVNIAKGHLYHHNTRVNTRADVEVLKYSKENNQLLIHLHGVTLVISRLPERAEDLFIHVIADPETKANYSHLYLPFSCTLFTSCTSHARGIEIQDSSNASYLLLQAKEAVEVDAQRIGVSLDSANTTLVFLSKESIDTQAQIEEVESSSLYRQGAMEEIIDTYLDNAYHNWNNRQYIASEGRWISREGKPFFDESVVLANLAEGWSRGNFVAIYNSMRRSAQRNSNHISIKSGLYLGDTTQLYDALKLQDPHLEERVLTALRNNSMDIVANYTYLQFGYYRAEPSTRELFIEWLTTINVYRLPIKSAINILRLAVESQDPRLAVHYHIVNTRILESMYIANAYLYLMVSQTQIDLYYTLLAGTLMRDIGLWQHNAQLQRIAEMLIISVLSLMDGGSYIPHSLHLSNNTIRQVEGILSPATLYPLLMSQSIYPRQYYDRLHNIHVWSPLQVSVSSAGNGITIDYPNTRDYSFYLLLENVARPTRVAINDQVYPNDLLFELRLRGRYWNAAHKVLYLKIEGSAATNKVEIQW